MKLGLMVGYSGATLNVDAGLVQHAEKVGFDSAWTAEAWGSDACSPLAWLAGQTETIKLGTAIMQLPGRTPANAAMTAMTIDALSGGRFIMGLGTSGPQVVEGWHGQSFKKPLSWMREYITIVKTIFAREEPLSHQGERYRLPYDGPGSTGQGKPLKSILHGRADLPIYTGSMGPKGQALAAELADGVILTCMNPERPQAVMENLDEGFARTDGAKSIDDFDIAAVVAINVGDDLEALRMPLRLQLGLYIGGMGSKSTNFYKRYLERAGFAEEANRIQELFLSGDKAGAYEAVTDELIDTLYLVGPKERIRDRLQVWEESPVTTMLVGAHDRATVELLAELNP